MSKSLGNLVLISDLKKRYTANAVRMYLLSRHYRSSFEFFERDMEKAKERERLFQKVWRAESLPPARPLDISAYRHAFFRALSADMQTPEALRVVEALAREVVKEKNRRNITDAKAFLNTAFSILGLQLAFQ